MGRPRADLLETRPERLVRFPANPQPTCDDPRFRDLLGLRAWSTLPEAVRLRFGKRLKGGATAVYVGHVTAMRRNRAGALLAQVLRVVGAPLPLALDVDVPSVISVTEDVNGGGQNWTRLYANRAGFPQIVHSAKRFDGPTGLEEYLGRGIVMALRASAENGALVFRDAGYHLVVGTRRFALPRFLHPGRLEVRHEDRGGGRFRFALTLTHPLFGELLHQSGIYRDEKP